MASIRAVAVFGVAVTTACAAALAAVPASAAGAATAGTGRDSGRGALVGEPQRLRAMTAGEVRTWLASDEFDVDGVRHGVDLYRLVYRTVDVRQRPTVASGLLVLPRDGKRRLRTVSYTHGTMSYKKDAPSTTDGVWGPGPAVTYASAGFAAVAPDYLGLGEGPGVHPWKDVPSETTASLDMLRAARHAAADKGRMLERDVLVTGFSQGASAALGLARALQEGGDRWFRLRAVAPISGAYHFENAELPALRDGELPPKLSVAYTAYLLTSWGRLHGLYRTPAEVFRQPYADRVEELFDGTTPGPQMLEALPGSLDELLTTRGWAMLRRPSGVFARALDVDAEVCTAWTPHVPIRLYKMDGDEQAVTANTDRCRTSLRARGVDAPVVDVGERTYEGSRHLGSNLAGTTMIVRWFRGLS
ncbi:hypothetical protein ABZ801_31090 [Actinomadura sp. NPDC047616]|uniref:alpha/beta hydrolase family protein n=1 Tax=Actinomadura sp. NPDC047616 TaxID=3155914 RepID=UPI0033FA4BB9